MEGWRGTRTPRRRGSRGLCQGTAGTHCGGAQRFVGTDPFSSECPICLGIVVALRQRPSEFALFVVRPDLATQFAQAHDAGLWRCLCAVVRVGEDQCDPLAKDATSLPLSMGGLGLLHSGRVGQTHYQWSGNAILRWRIWSLTLWIQIPQLQSSRATLSHGARPPPREPDEFEPGCSPRGWQHEAAGPTERMHHDTFMPRVTDSEQAALRSQSGPRSGLALSSTPSCPTLRIESHLFRVLLLRRLRLPLPPVSRTCRCGRLLDPFGHHRAACSRAGVLGRRGFALESVGTRICREAGARVSTNVFV